ncbi:hypothetical protein [Microbispora rosea]|uniref:hypothetical protein n=1 Tax=Microbispora rosea TaxID=58117 RepID=UPI0004C3A87A|nr:hypothetical protein [Microbispora rosea]
MSAFERGESGSYEFVDPDAVLTPVEAERFLKLLHNAVSFATRDLRNARNEELQCFKAYLTARKPHELDPDCPEVGTGVGKVSAKVQELWFERRVPEEYWAWKSAVIVRQDAAEYARQLDKQVRILQSLSSLAKLGYETYPRGGR